MTRDEWAGEWGRTPAEWAGDQPHIMLLAFSRSEVHTAFMPDDQCGLARDMWADLKEAAMEELRRRSTEDAAAGEARRALDDAVVLARAARIVRLALERGRLRLADVDPGESREVDRD